MGDCVVNKMHGTGELVCALFEGIYCRGIELI